MRTDHRSQAIHLRSMEVGERFSLVVGPHAPIFTLVSAIGLDEHGLEKSYLRALDPVGGEWTLSDIYIANNDSYRVYPVGPAPAPAPSPEGGGA